MRNIFFYLLGSVQKCFLRLVLKFYQNFHLDFLKFSKFRKDHAEKSKLVPYDILPLKRDHFLNTEFARSKVESCHLRSNLP